MNSTTQMLENNYKKSDLNNKENKVKGLYTIYNMNSTVQMADENLEKKGADKKENKVRGLYTIYNMNSTAQMADKNLEKKGPDKTGNMIKGLSTIYNMDSKKQMTAKQTYTNLLDTNVPEINVPIMELSEIKPSRKNRFNFREWFQNAVRQTSLQIADWILNTGKKIITKLPLPAKIKDLVELVMKSKYHKVPSQNPNQNNKLSEKKNTAFKNNAIVYKLKVLNPDDPLNQMMLLNTRKTYLLEKRLNLLKGIKCNETLEVKFEKLGSEGQMIEKSFTFTSRPQLIMSKTGIETALQNMRSDIEKRIDRFTLEGSGWAVIGALNHDLHVNKYDPLAARSYIPLPEEIQKKKATVNLKNKDDRCFIYCLGRALDPNPEKNHLDRVSTHLKNVCETLGLNTIKTPVNIQDVPKIEKQFNVSINIYGHSNSDIYPIHKTYSTAAKHVDLLVNIEFWNQSLCLD